MNLSSVNQHVRAYAERPVQVINEYIRTMYTPNFITSFKQGSYFMLRNTLSNFNFAISGETNIKYHDILHIYTFLKSQILASYPEISFEDIINNKLANQISITVDEYIGLYAYSMNKVILNYSSHKILLSEYNSKAYVLSKLMDKIRFKLLMEDYDQNQEDYKKNPDLDRLLGNNDFATYLSIFIY